MLGGSREMVSSLEWCGTTFDSSSSSSSSSLSRLPSREVYRKDSSRVCPTPPCDVPLVCAHIISIVGHDIPIWPIWICDINLITCRSRNGSWPRGHTWVPNVDRHIYRDTLLKAKLPPDSVEVEWDYSVAISSLQKMIPLHIKQLPMYTCPHVHPKVGSSFDNLHRQSIQGHSPI